MVTPTQDQIMGYNVLMYATMPDTAKNVMNAHVSSAYVSIASYCFLLMGLSYRLSRVLASNTPTNTPTVM